MRRLVGNALYDIVSNGTDGHAESVEIVTIARR